MNATPLISNRTYDVLKKVAQYWLPALGTLYFALAGIWGLPYGEQIVGSIVAVDIFLGVILGYSTAKYNKSDAKFDGAMNVDYSADQEFKLEFKEELPDLVDQDEITLKVNRLSH